MAHYWKAQAKEVNRGTAPSVGRYATSDARRPETLDSPFGFAGILTVWTARHRGIALREPPSTSA
jgi:hypothetical protein